MIPCPECGAQQYPGTLFCDVCGAAVHQAAQAHVAAAKAAAGRPAVVRPAPETTPSPPGAAARPAEAPPIIAPSLRVRIPHHNTEFIVRGAIIQVGRADPDGSAAPELDLTAYGGQERGVSRRHASVRWVEGGYVLIDEHSTNGTWLNGTRLVAGYAYQIPPGAQVRFGGLVVQLSIAD